ncbi:hypothetical protein OG568_47620 [Streptomyces sp. NBC_01450]|uniref:hypothetical protein n=1 Tax=Streptomyces sp. NBC_01450 TaxID=2903871 RepID=UPI002E367A2D|nr:hypothetical protein [Streptomyces sp. NBC_01450]
MAKPSQPWLGLVKAGFGLAALVLGGGSQLLATIKVLALPGGLVALSLAAAIWVSSKWVSAAEDHPPLRPLNRALGPLGAAGVLGGQLWLGPVAVLLSSFLLISAGVWFLIDGTTDVMVFRRLP